MQERGYYDIFLFDTDGDLVYTVFEELDYATNVMNRKYKDTDLGNAFRAAMKLKQGEQASYNVQTFATAAVEISASIKEIAGNVEQASAGTREVTATISSVSKKASTTGAAASEVQESAKQLSDESQNLSNVVQGFLVTIRIDSCSSEQADGGSAEPAEQGSEEDDV